MKNIITSIENILKYIIEQIKSIKITELTLHKIEVFTLIIGVAFAICNLNQINKQIEQSNLQINQINKQIDLMHDQNQLYSKDLNQQKRFEEIALIQDISKTYFEKGGMYYNMIEIFRNKDKDKSKQFSEQEILGFLNTIDYINWLDDQKIGDMNNKLFYKNDIDFNFGYIIRIVCPNRYFQDKVKQYNYAGITKLCNKNGF